MGFCVHDTASTHWRSSIIIVIIIILLSLLLFVFCRAYTGDLHMSVIQPFPLCLLMEVFIVLEILS